MLTHWQDAKSTSLDLIKHGLRKPSPVGDFTNVERRALWPTCCASVMCRSRCETARSCVVTSGDHDRAKAVPALLQRQPYDKRMAQAYVYAHPAWYARQGYGVVVQDSRGRGSSEGNFYPLRGDANDGVDTIAWCAAQSWCSGKVASFGFSLPGLNQLLAAAEKPSRASHGDPRLLSAGHV